MPSLEIFPNYDDQPHNPFSATIGSDDANYESGFIRIEPPIRCDAFFLERNSGEVEVSIGHLVTDATASMFAYDVNVLRPDEHIYDVHGGPKERVAKAVSTILEELGFLGSKEYFKEYWERY